MKQWKGIVIHHSESKDDPDKNNTNEIKRWHTKDFGWNDIGYHYVVELFQNEYKIFTGRSLETNGAHAIGFNTTHIGICCVGNFDETNPPEAQLDRLKELCWNLMQRYSISPEDVIGHRETYKRRGVKQEKTCPGNNFDIDKFRQRLVSLKNKIEKAKGENV